MAVIPSILLLFLGLLPWFIGLPMLCPDIPIFIMVFYFATSYPLAAEACFDFAQCEVTYTATYFLRFPRHIDWCVPFHEVVELDQPLRLRGHSAIRLTLQNGTKLVMEFQGYHADSLKLFRRLATIQRRRRAL